MQDGAPGGNRTPDPQLRRLLLYPTELLALQARQAGVRQASSCQVGAPGFEPGTSCSQSRRDARLRYAPHETPNISGSLSEGQLRESPRVTAHFADLRAILATEPPRPMRRRPGRDGSPDASARLWPPQ